MQTFVPSNNKKRNFNLNKIIVKETNTKQKKVMKKQDIKLAKKSVKYSLSTKLAKSHTHTHIRSGFIFFEKNKNYNSR